MFPTSQSKYKPLLLAASALILIAGLAYLVYSNSQAPASVGGPTGTLPPTSSTSSGSIPPAAGTTSTPTAPTTTTRETPKSENKTSIEGTLVCLPHKDTTGPQTLECAFGLKDRQGRYYGLRDTDPTYRNISGVPMNVPVLVKGDLTLKGDLKYQSIGVIEVESITRLDRSPASGQSVIRGIVLLGPQCPVVREGEDCPDKPYATTLSLTSPDGARVIKNFKSDAQGRFTVEATPGNYAIRSAATANILPYCQSSNVTVREKTYIEITVSCDTGIR